MRHTHATLALAAGHNAKVISERLGHYSVSFTLDTYSHVIPGMQQALAADFSAMIDRPGGRESVEEPLGAASHRGENR